MPRNVKLTIEHLDNPGAEPQHMELPLLDVANMLAVISYRDRYSENVERMGTPTDLVAPCGTCKTCTLVDCGRTFATDEDLEAHMIMHSIPFGIDLRIASASADNIGETSVALGNVPNSEVRHRSVQTEPRRKSKSCQTQIKMTRVQQWIEQERIGKAAILKVEQSYINSMSAYEDLERRVHEHNDQLTREQNKSAKRLSEMDSQLENANSRIKALEQKLLAAQKYSLEWLSSEHKGRLEAHILHFDRCRQHAEAMCKLFQDTGNVEEVEKWDLYRNRVERGCAHYAARLELSEQILTSASERLDSTNQSLTDIRATIDQKSAKISVPYMPPLTAATVSTGPKCNSANVNVTKGDTLNLTETKSGGSKSTGPKCSSANVNVTKGDTLNLERSKVIETKNGSVNGAVAKSQSSGCSSAVIYGIPVAKISCTPKKIHAKRQSPHSPLNHSSPCSSRTKSGNYDKTPSLGLESIMQRCSVSELDCIICWDTVHANGALCPSCKKVFHTKCLEQWQRHENGPNVTFVCPHCTQIWHGYELPPIR